MTAPRALRVLRRGCVVEYAFDTAIGHDAYWWSGKRAARPRARGAAGVRGVFDDQLLGGPESSRLPREEDRENTMSQGHRPHHGGQGRDDLAGEHALGDAGQLLLAIVFAAILISDSFFFRYTTLLNSIVPLWVRLPVGAAALGLAGYLARASMSIVFGEVREPPTVIRTGVFGLVRHPMYLGEALLYYGLLMMSISLAAVAVWIVAIAFLFAISRFEEKLLVARFGKAYSQYMRDVPMWIPRLRS